MVNCCTSHVAGHIVSQQFKNPLSVRLSSPHGAAVPGQHIPLLANGFLVNWRNDKLEMSDRWKRLLLVSHLVFSILNHGYTTADAESSNNIIPTSNIKREVSPPPLPRPQRQVTLMAK